MFDSDKDAINTEDDYKIMLADGSELGLAIIGTTTRQIDSCGPTPASSGAIFQWSTDPRASEDADSSNWAVGERGYLTGIMINSEGEYVTRYLGLTTKSLNSDELDTPILGWFKDEKFAKGFTAQQTSGNRIALFGYDDKQNKKHGLRPYPLDKNHADRLVVLGDKSANLPLDCQFVKVLRLGIWLHGETGEFKQL